MGFLLQTSRKPREDIYLSVINILYGVVGVRTFGFVLTAGVEPILPVKHGFSLRKLDETFCKAYFALF